MAGGIRPRLGIRFEELGGASEDRLLARLGRQTAPPDGGDSAGVSTDAAADRDLRFVLVEPTRAENRGRALVTIFALGTIVVLALLLLLYLVSWIG